MPANEADFKQLHRELLRNVQVVNGYGSSPELKAKVLANPEVKIWLSKLAYKSLRAYTDGFCYFLRSINMDDPSKLLDLKGYDDSKARFFPAEQLMDYWIVLAKENKVPAYRIKKVVDCVRSFFKHNRVRLMDVTFSYKPKDKPALCREDLLHFRDNMTAHGRRLFDFLISVPVRDGQFAVCPNCGRDFHPRWSNIVGYPLIELYSAFVISPEKGHESPQYSEGLRQVCFLTQTVCDQLNALRVYREKVLGKPVNPADYIFTYSQSKSSGGFQVTPLTGPAVKMLFYNTQPKAGMRIYPHLIRSYVNAVLAACGIDKQVRDVYLGHSCSYEMGYIIQMIPLWREMFKKRHVLETLDILNPSQHQVIELERKVQQLEADKVSDVERMKADLMRLMDKRYELLKDKKD